MAIENNNRSSFNYNKVYLLLTCMFLVVYFLELSQRIEFFKAIRFEFFLGVILSGFAALNLGEAINEPSILRKYIFLFFVIAIIQIPFSYDYEISKEFFVDRILKYSMLTLFIVSFVKGPEAMKIFIAVYLLVCFRLLYEGFHGWATGNLVWQSQGVMRLHGSIPALGHPNSFSSFAVCLLPFIYFLFFHVRKTFKLFFIVMLFFAVVVIVFTASRSGYVATICFFAVLFLKSQNKFKIGVVILIVISAAWQFTPEQYKGRFQSIYSEDQRQSGSVGARMQIMQDAIDISIKHPFGVGIAAFSKVRDMYFNRQQNVHNLYFEVLTNLGVQGLIVCTLLIAALFKILRQGRAKLRQVLEKIQEMQDENSSDEGVKDAQDIIWLIALSNAVTYFLILRLSLGLFGMDLYQIVWWFLFGVAIALDRMSKIYYSAYDC